MIVLTWRYDSWFTHGPNSSFLGVDRPPRGFYIMEDFSTTLVSYNQTLTAVNSLDT